MKTEENMGKNGKHEKTVTDISFWSKSNLEDQLSSLSKFLGSQNLSYIANQLNRIVCFCKV